MRFSIIFIIFFSVSSCSTTRIEYNLIDELNSCYDDRFNVELSKLIAELDKHIKRNNHETFSNYLTYLENGNLADIHKYGESEKALGTHFLETSFKKLFCDYTYVEGGRNGKVLTYEDYLANPRKVAIKKDFSHSKTFLKCLHSVRNNSAFVDDFLNLDMKTTSPNDFISWVFNYQNKEAYNETIAKQIIALDVYLIVLELLGDKSNCANADCP